MGLVRVEAVSKAFRTYPTRWARLAEWLIPGASKRHTDHWVLRNVSFEVKPGEAVGIIGINGAGKSTLLKIIAGTTQPSTGIVRVEGTLAALLELGMGFHPDFTGRQNAVMSAQLLGYSAAEIRDLMPDIEAFAEIGQYFDQPVRVYSSGMQMRLAFSVATARRPDILIIDEALSVGDAYFQHKSFARIRAFNAMGTTLLLVSHDKAAVQAICQRALLLDGGEVAFVGGAVEAMDFYNARIAQREGEAMPQQIIVDGRTQTSSGTGEVSIGHVSLHDRQGAPVEVVQVGQTVAIHVRIGIRTAVEDLAVGVMIRDRLGQAVFGTNTAHLNVDLGAFVAGDMFEVVFALPANIGVGHYSITVAAHRGYSHVGGNFAWLDHAIVFHVVDGDKAKFDGLAWLPTQVTVMPISGTRNTQ